VRHAFGIKLDHPTFVSHVGLKDTHTCLEYKCVEAAPDAAPAADGADNTESLAAALLSLPPLNMLAKQQTPSEEEIGAGHSLPVQSRVTKQVMRHWVSTSQPRRCRPTTGASRCSRHASMQAELPCHLAHGGGRTRAFHPGRYDIIVTAATP
jgi:hypothetical protein